MTKDNKADTRRYQGWTHDEPLEEARGVRLEAKAEDEPEEEAALEAAEEEPAAAELDPPAAAADPEEAAQSVVVPCWIVTWSE